MFRIMNYFTIYLCEHLCIIQKLYYKLVILIGDRNTHFVYSHRFIVYIFVIIKLLYYINLQLYPVDFQSSILNIKIYYIKLTLYKQKPQFCIKFCCFLYNGENSCIIIALCYIEIFKKHDYIDRIKNIENYKILRNLTQSLAIFGGYIVPNARLFRWVDSQHNNRLY